MDGASGAFDQGLDVPGKDPFGGGDGMDEFDRTIPGEEPTAPAQESAEIPVVNADGDRLDQPAQATEAEEQQLAAAQQAAAEAGIETTDVAEEPPRAEAAVPVETEAEAIERQRLEAGQRDAEIRSWETPALRDFVASQPQDHADMATVRDEIGKRRGQAAQADPSPASSEAPGEAAGAASEAEEKGGGAAEDPTAATPGEAATSPQAASGEPGAGEQGSGEPVADAPEERKSPSGTVTHRQYELLVPTGLDTFKRLSWYEDKDGKMVPTGTSGAKKQVVCLARGQEDALGIGYAALGEPEGGAKIVAIATTYFQVRHVEPEKTQVRQKLKIR